MNPTEIATAQRHLHLLEKVKGGKTLTKKEISELEKYEKMGQKNAQETRGRKSKYAPAMNKTAKRLCGKGLTDKQLCEFFGVTEQTLNNWKKQFPLFFESLKRGKAMADAQVEAALFQRAVGYSVPDVHISSYEGDITITPIIKHYPPDVVAQIFWLKNRKPKKWRDRQEFEHSGSVDGCGVMVVPVGMSKEQWKQFAKENQKPNKKS